MLKVTIKIEDELGVSVEKVANYVDKTFSLSTFDEIEGLMELAKQDIFPVIESDLLQMQQDNFKKKFL